MHHDAIFHSMRPECAGILAHSRRPDERKAASDGQQACCACQRPPVPGRTVHRQPCDCIQTASSATERTQLVRVSRLCAWHWEHRPATRLDKRKPLVRPRACRCVLHRPQQTATDWNRSEPVQISAWCECQVSVEVIPSRTAIETASDAQPLWLLPGDIQIPCRVRPAADIVGYRYDQARHIDCVDIAQRNVWRGAATHIHTTRPNAASDIGDDKNAISRRCDVGSIGQRLACCAIVPRFDKGEAVPDVARRILHPAAIGGLLVEP